MKLRWSAFFVLGSLGLWGCNGGQSGGELGLDELGGTPGTGGMGTGGGGETGGYGTTTATSVCEETRTPLRVDEVSPLGFTTEKILEFAAGIHEATLAYNPDHSEFTQVNLTPSSDEAALTVVIEPKGTAEFVDLSPGQQTGGGLLAIDWDATCRNYLAIPVTATVTTDDGAFAESLDAELVARLPSLAMLNAQLDLDKLAGDFAVEVVSPAGGIPTQTAFNAALGLGVFAGEISGTIEVTGPQVATAAGATYAKWGYGSCGRGQAPAGVGALSTEGLLAALNEASPLGVTWGDGSTADLTLSYAAAGELCMDLDSPYSIAPGTYVMSAQLEIASSDGRLQATYPVAIRATSSGDEAETIAVQMALYNPVDPSAFESTFGMTGVEFGDYTDASLALTLDYDVGHESVSGELAVKGIPPNDCVDTPTSVCGSPGPEDVETASIGSP